MSSNEVQIHNPVYARPAVEQADRKHVDFPSVADGGQLRIAFVDNEKPNTSRLWELVEEQLQTRYDVETTHLFKGGAAHAASTEVIQQAASSADVAVLATAD